MSWNYFKKKGIRKKEKRKKGLDILIPPKAQRMKKIKKSNQKSIKLFDDQVLNLKFDEGQNSEKKNQIKVKCKEVSSSKKVKQFQKKKKE